MKSGYGCHQGITTAEGGDHDRPRLARGGRVPLWAADSPGGGILFAVRQAGLWVPAWTTSDGYPLWRGEPRKTRLAAQRAAEREVLG